MMLWLASKLGGVTAQAIGVVAIVAALMAGLAWLRYDARQDERAKLQTQMANARIQQLLLRQRAEKQAMAVGSRAEQDLLKELDASESIINGLEKKLSERQAQCNPAGRVICYPAKVASELNK